MTQEEIEEIAKKETLKFALAYLSVIAFAVLWFIALVYNPVLIILISTVVFCLSGIALIFNRYYHETLDRLKRENFGTKFSE